MFTAAFSDLSTAELAPWIGGGAALLGALALTPLVIRLARRWGWVDRPTKDRWSNRPVALLGGIAIAGAIGIGVAVGGAAGAYRWPVWVGAGLMFAVGLIDDLWRVRPEAKVLAQVLAAVLLLYAGYAFWPGGPLWASLPLTFVWVIGVTNALNLIDGLDGLAAGIAVIAAGVLAVISGVLGQGELAVVAAALAGAALGFLAYNVSPARIFMGDCGSLFLGYMLAVGALAVQGSGEPVAGTLVPIAVLAVPIIDTTFVTVTRLLRGRPVSEGNTDHVHHRLVHLGFSERRAVAMLWGGSAAFGGMALAALWMRPALTLAVATLCLVTAAVIGAYLATTRDYASPDAPPATSGLTKQVSALLRAFLGGASWKSVAGVGADLLVVGAAFVLAVHLRYGGVPPPEWSDLMVRALPGIIALKLVVFYAFGLYEGIWRHAGTPEVVRLVNASTVGTVLAGCGLALATKIDAGVLSVFLLDWGVATFGVGGTRFAFRGLRQYVIARREEGRRVLVYGSGDDGMLLLRHLRYHPELDRTVVGILDDDPSRHGRRAQGVEVLGGVEDLPRLCSGHDVEEVIVPAQSVPTALRRRVRAQCAEAGVDCQYFEAALRAAGEPDGPVLAPAPGNGAPEEDPQVSSS